MNKQGESLPRPDDDESGQGSPEENKSEEIVQISEPVPQQPTNRPKRKKVNRNAHRLQDG